MTARTPATAQPAVTAQPLDPPRLSRADGPPVRPVRMVHVGLGNFFRAHQAWYTERAGDAERWGIAAFTGRSPAAAAALGPQQGLYTLVVKGEAGPTFEVVGALSAVHPAADDAAWESYWRAPELAVVTLTVTEAGYRRAAGGGLDVADPEVAADVAALRRGEPAVTAPGRLVAGCLGRRAAGGGPVAVVSCDNLPENGRVLREVVEQLADRVDPTLRPWLAGHVSFVTTMVDRITPATTDDDRALVAAGTGRSDASPVVTEPFSEWVLQGEFPAGRPRWEDAGALLVEDVRPFEQRKLWLLNGSHSLLAYAGSARGHATVRDAIADPVCRGWVEQWWDEAARHLPLPAEAVGAYRAALLERFANPAMAHRLAQIAADGSQKIPVRVVPTLRAELAAGRVPFGACRVVGAWVAHLRGAGAPVSDADPGVAGLAAGPLDAAVRRVLERLGADLAADPRVVEAVTAAAAEPAA